MANPGNIYDMPLIVLDGPGNKQPDMYSAVTIPLVLAITAVILRFYSRRVNRAQLWLDDWLMLPALLATIISSGVAYWALAHGDGKYIGVATFGKLRQMGIVIFAAELLYCLVITLVKFSILALYWRIFPTRWIRISVWVLAFIIAAWEVSCTTVVLLQCRPLRGFWDKTIEADCPVELKPFLISTAIINTVTDIVMLAIPITACLRLQQTRVNKLLLVGVFATGFLVTIVSIVRLVALFHMNITDTLAALNITWSFIDVSMWSEVEQNIAIISGCLPCLKPVLAKIVPASLVPSSLRKLGTPSNSGASSSKKSGLSGSKNAWIKGGSWRNRQRNKNGGTFTELMETGNPGSDSELPLGAQGARHDSSDTADASDPGEIESGASGTSVRLDSPVPEVEYEHELVTWKAHDPGRNSTG